jgi:hypothetical protein
MAGARGLGQGIENAGALMGDAMQKRKAEEKEMKTAVKTLEYLKKNGYGDFDTENMSPRSAYETVQGLMGSVQIGRGMQQEQAATQERDRADWLMENARNFDPSKGGFDLSGNYRYPPQPQRTGREPQGYFWELGDPAQVLLDDNTIGVADPVGGYYKPHPISSQKGFRFINGGMEEYMMDKVDTANMPRYADVVARKQAAAPAATAAASGGAKVAPKPGEVRSGYRFKGGDPASQANWEPVQ